MNRERFEQLVTRAVETLPEEFLDRLENIVVVVENRPTSTQLAEARVGRSHTLLGLYEGVPLTKRGRNYGLVPPDMITIFQKPIESECKNDAEITTEIQKVVQHEIAHHFGIGEATLKQIEKAKSKRKGESAQ
jgi:predicted Zn-dependent protease with MMP-like domain